MTIWNAKALYEDNAKKYQVLPYDLYGTMKTFFCMEDGLKDIFLFVKNLRFSCKSAQRLAEKYNCQILKNS